MAVNCPKIELFPSLLDALGLKQGILSTLALQPSEQKPILTKPQFTATLQQNTTKYTFAVSAKNRSTPKNIENAMLEADWNAAELDQLPMIVVPYLNDRELVRLEERNISGVDLCGNFIINVRNTLYLRSSGKLNRFKDSAPTKFAYKNTTSLVPRLFLIRPTFKSVSEIQNIISELGCSVALSTVSKALRKMEDDLLITRKTNQIQLLQADELLHKLQINFQFPSTTSKATFSCNLPIAELFIQSKNVVLSGASSYDQYCAGIRGDKAVFYCSNLNSIKESLATELTETNRFADLTIKETQEKTPFFDGRLKNGGTLYASPVQTYLELSVGDKREQQMAKQIKKQILNNLPIL